MLTQHDFFEPILSTIIPIPIAPTISPTPNDTIASIDNSNLNDVSLSSRVSVIIGSRIPVYTAMLTPVQQSYGISGLIFLETKRMITPLISDQKPGYELLYILGLFLVGVVVSC